jgi:hypothetical protein
LSDLIVEVSSHKSLRALPSTGTGKKEGSGGAEGIVDPVIISFSVDVAYLAGYQV